MEINRDTSLPYRVFISFPSPPRFGDYAVFPFKGKDMDLLKRIECTEGDEIIRKGREFYCLHYLGKALEKTKDGKPLSPSSFEGKIEKGCYWMKGDHVRSYDSRYFGPVCGVKRKAVPLF